MKFAKKSLGQNFLIDKNIIKKIINIVDIRNKNIIEIGPGTGALTEEILKNNPKSLILIEKDISLHENLILKFSHNNILKLYNDDILSINIEKLIKEETVIFGNLPYNISSQILVKFLKFKTWPPKFNDLILMFQKELADKIIGEYLSTNYGRLSIISNYRLKVFKKFNISANCFIPKPKVTSTLLHFRPIKKNKFKIKNINNLEKVTNVLFSGRRKMINKNIKKILSEKEISQIQGLQLKSRPSQLNPDIYYKITEFFEKKY
ncbi:16S rRNA (adenine(1518)-N(6)/adenine(1519)-N(6))-dimethyltransferase RsmA [Candidatus Pelagibacter communis]|uniref:16S rRNA (adenine(1518)-N(6)/adenine(1519)-N(6))- dimethyltransferase RsmA n=1 Tax=Pelagibacter ubique TaxID=198252 RepID=UPI00094D18A6|nr:16S rRNA (adenine(1518)-N(6)/adenine(1519)-N(6))-dimethyltransferase RsmA [Candidatus Pelagibacter ubique]